MNFEKEVELRTEFRKVLFDLAKGQEFLKQPKDRFVFFKRLEKLYYQEDGKDEFRHFYSDIFSVIIQIYKDPNLGSIEELGQNLDILRNGYKVCNKDKNGDEIDISKSLNKLYDHVNLDVARLNYLNIDKEISSEENVHKIKGVIDELKEDISESRHLLVGSMVKIENAQKESVSILGIFAAIVLAFTGGITFSTSVLQNIDNISIYRAIVVILLLGFVLINILYGLFYYINKIIYNKSKDKKIAPLVITNVVIICSIIITIVCWSFGVVETRNRKYENFKGNNISTSQAK